MTYFSRYFLFAICFAATSAFAASAGTTSSELDTTLSTENVDGGVINFDMGDVNLSNQVRAVQSNGTFTFVPGANITINGMGNTLNGGGTTRGFFVGGRNADGTGSVTINNLNFGSCRARGGNGSGGGMGAGGGLFVGKNTKVTVEDCSFANCSAVGGIGLTGNKGGGGMGGTSGSGSSLAGGGGGGFGGNGDSGSLLFSFYFGGGGGGASGFPPGDAFGSTGGSDFAGSTSPGSGVGGKGGVGGSFGFTGGFGGGGGGGSGSSSFPIQGGGNGGYGSGGGDPHGSGGFGGGGASRGNGNGGFGGGGGNNLGTGGFGGGTGTTTLGGKGAGFGGAIFIEDGGDLTIKWTLANQPFSGSSIAAGSGGTSNTDPNAGFGALGRDIFMMSGSLLTFDITSDVILSHPIQGNVGSGGGDPDANGLTKTGTGLLLLTGDNTYSGTTTVEGGELRINSSVITPIVVESDGLLSGNFSAKAHGSITNSGNLTNNGTVSPGIGGAGTIELEGEFKQTGSGILQIDITPDGNVHDRIMGATKADLAGTMEVIVNAGNYIKGTQYVVTDAPTNTTEFDNVIEIGDLENLIDIGVTYSSVIITILEPRIFEDQDIAAGVSRLEAKCIREANIIPGSDFAQMVEILGTLSNKQVNEALTSLSAVRFGALEWINARNNSLSADILSDHLFELCCSPRECGTCNCNGNVWVSVFGNFMNNREPLDNLRRYDADAVGALAGVDFCCSDCFYYGGAFGYTYTHLDWKKHGGRGNINSYYGALYSSWVCDCLSVDLSILGGGSDNDLKRKIAFADVSRTAHSDFWGYFVTTHLGFRSKAQWHWCSVLEPFALVDYHYYTHKSFTEKGADSLNLRVKSKDQHMMRGEAGLLWNFERDCGCFCYAPYLGISWVGEFSLHKSKQPASFIGQSCVTNATSYNSTDIHLGAPQAGVKWTHCNGASFSLGYKGLFNKCTHINQVEGRFEWVF